MKPATQDLTAGGADTAAPATAPRRRLPDRTTKGRVRQRFRHLLRRRPLDRDGLGDGLQMGRHSYFRPVVEWQWGDSGEVRVGSYCSIAHDAVMMVGGNHPSGFVSTFAFRAQFGLPGAFEDGVPESRGDIEIGNDAYIGREARVLSGVRIGDGALIGAYSVVAKDVRPYAIVVGNPGREVARRFSDEQVERLLRIRWWDWPEDKILREVPLLSSDRVDEFLDRHDPPAGG
jgi:acetyltransferase-like isoleucine patch superfamily enzyme